MTTAIEHPLAPRTEWVRETRIGTWFLSTPTWLDHVLKVALRDLVPMMPARQEPFSTVLDLGCGHGRALPLLEERFRPARLVGIDVDPELIAKAQVERARCHVPVDLKTGSATRIDLDDASVDLVFCHQSFHHFADQEAVGREILRVLKPGGMLLFAESCRRYIHSFLIRLLFRHPMDVQKTAEEYVELLRSLGFEIAPERVSTPYLWWSRPDLGALEFFGFPVPEEREHTLVNLIAIRPG